MKSWLGLILLLFMTSGCDGRNAPANRQKSEAKPAPKPAAFSCSTNDQAPWLCLQRACESAGGTFNTRLSECECQGENSRFVGWDTPACESPSGGRYNNSEDLRAENSAGLDFKVLDDETFTSSEMSSLRSAFRSARLPYFLESKVIGYQQTPDALSAGEIKRLLYQPEIQLQPKEKRVLGDDGFSETFYYDSGQTLERIFRSQDVVDKNFRAPTSVSQAELITEALHQTGWTEEVFSASELGCLGTCRSVKRALSRMSSAVFNETTIWVGGAPYKRTLSIFLTPNDVAPAAIVVRSPRGRPTLFITLKDQSRDLSYGRLAVVQNLRGEEIGQLAIEIPKATEVVDATTAADVIMCESNFDLPEEPLLKQVAFGPFRQQSFFGWMSGAGLNDFYSGLMVFSESGFRDYSDLADPIFLVDKKAGAHGRHVFKELTNTPVPLRILPLGAAECRSQALLKQKELESFLPKILNYSTGQSLGPNECQRLNPLLGETPFLWVFAAGNEGFRSRKDGMKLICPQNSVPTSHSIVVGALGVDGQIASYSNAIETHVDIFASGQSMAQQSGTSFAAPKVSQVAAIIAKKYPRMDVESIRLSVLIGAKLQDGLPCKSRGVLNLEGALYIANALDRRDKNQRVEAVLRAVFRKDPKLLKKKLEVLKAIL